VATSLHSGKAKINYLTLRVVEMRDGESWCKYALRPALFLAGPSVRLVQSAKASHHSV